MSFHSERDATSFQTIVCCCFPGFRNKIGYVIQKLAQFVTDVDGRVQLHGFISSLYSKSVIKLWNVIPVWHVQYQPAMYDLTSIHNAVFSQFCVRYFTTYPSNKQGACCHNLNNYTKFNSCTL